MFGLVHESVCKRIHWHVSVENLWCILNVMLHVCWGKCVHPYACAFTGMLLWKMCRVSCLLYCIFKYVTVCVCIHWRVSLGKCVVYLVYPMKESVFRSCNFFLALSLPLCASHPRSPTAKVQSKVPKIALVMDPLLAPAPPKK